MYSPLQRFKKYCKLNLLFRKAVQLLIGLNLTFIKFKLVNVKVGNFYILLLSRYNFYCLFKLTEMSVILFCVLWAMTVISGLGFYYHLWFWW